MEDETPIEKERKRRERHQERKKHEGNHKLHHM